ncbi:type IV pilin [Halorubellus sp. JP-L1]|uniref:type IV pilin n=1 Tax=Halorubellus sp. JP-L1 TaxID=2715753 RepID=UPI0014080D22|nr:type IV pilin N-terminal domain-containing protein [Halorubellus sp. JP-L1]NHN42109.1 type IV pilin [Halorubellus sp. JP-L1]
MQLWNLLADDDAVSPVIGVVLMVGITVALAAVIGIFVLGVDTTTSPPDAELRYVADEGSADGWGNDADERFVIQHDGGEDIDTDRVTVQYAGSPPSGYGWMTSNPPGDVWQPGEKWVLGVATGESSNFDDNEQVLVLWNSPQGSSTQILANGDLPERS